MVDSSQDRWTALGPKTRVLIFSSSPLLVQLTLHTLDIHNKPIISKVFNEPLRSEESDFILFATDNLKEAAEFSPNIVLLGAVPELDSYNDLLISIRAGGILLYPKESQVINQELKEVAQFFRKIPYEETTCTNNSLETDLGSVELNFDDSLLISHLDGVRNVLQHLGVMEEEFYQALSEFELI